MRDPGPDHSRKAARRRGAKDESEATLERLFRTHYRPLRAYGLKIAGSEPLVEDAIQDVFLSLWEGDTQLSEITHPKSYLLTALRRKVLARVAAQQSRRQRDRQYMDRSCPFTISREELLIGEELKAAQRKQLEEALNKLSERRREALYLRFYHGLIYKEIAGVMDIRQQTAANYVFEALQFLRKQPFLKVPEVEM